MPKLKDFYKVLGVDPTAEDDEIRRAFRRLSKAFHPDVSKADDAAERMQEVKEAYDILIDPDMRASYDEMRANGGSVPQAHITFQGLYDLFYTHGQSNLRPVGGGDAFINVPFTVTDAILGTEHKIGYVRRIPCKTCAGLRFVAPTSHVCKTCGGIGGNTENLSTPFGRITQTVDCEDCHGYGVAGATPCIDCQATGKTTGHAEVAVRTPPQVYDGYLEIIAGGGHTGREGGPDGNLVVCFQHDPLDKFRMLKGRDIGITFTIPLSEAFTGGKYQLAMPDGEMETFEVFPVAATGHQIILSGRGLHGESGERGACYVQLEVQMPHRITRQAGEQIAKILEGATTP